MIKTISVTYLLIFMCMYTLYIFLVFRSLETHLLSMILRRLEVFQLYIQLDTKRN